MSPIQNSAVIFNEIPSGYPEPGKTTIYNTSEMIDLDTVALNGGILIKTLVLSNDPYLRGKMRDVTIKSYSPAFILGKPLYNYGVGRILRSEDPKFKVGTHITGFLNFQEYSVIPSSETPKLTILENKEKLPWSAYIGVAGMPGRTAYFGYKEFSKAKKSETIFISTGAGAVGSLLIQLAKLDGLKVIASAGSDEKVRFMKELGADVAFNYKMTDTEEVLKKEGPLDIYWDNVGGYTLDSALGNTNVYARIIACGQMSVYNEADGYGYKNLIKMFANSLRISGFIEMLLADKWATAFYAEIPGRIASGQVKYREERTYGLESVGEAIRKIQRGNNVGKSVIVVAED